MEANKHATNLLLELELEKTREQSKKEAASRRKRKKKQKRLEKKQDKLNKELNEDEDEDDDEDEEDEEEDEDEEYEEEDEEEETTVIEVPPPPPPTRQEVSKDKKKKKNNNSSSNTGGKKNAPDKNSSKVIATPKNTNGKKTKEENEERDSGIDSTSQTSATSETADKVTSDASRDNKNKKKKKRKDGSKEDTKINSNNNNTTSTVEQVTKNIKNLKVSSETNQSSAKEAKSSNESKTNTNKSSNIHKKDHNNESISSDNNNALVKKKSQRNETVPVKTGSGIGELDTFNDEVSPDVVKKMKTLSINSSSSARNAPDSVASLDTFGENVIPLPTISSVSAIPGLMSVPSGLLASHHCSPKKQVSPRGGHQEGWKEVNRKSKKVTVANSAISRIIGRGGCNINAIREASNAHIEVEKQSKSQGDRMIIVKGHKDSTQLAITLITELRDDPDKDVQELIAKHAPPKPTRANKQSSITLASSSGAPEALFPSKPAPLVSIVAPAPPAPPPTHTKPVASTVVAPPVNSWVVPPVVTSSVSSPKKTQPAEKRCPASSSQSQTLAARLSANTTATPPPLSNGPLRSPAVRQLFREGTEGTNKIINSKTPPPPSHTEVISNGPPPHITPQVIPIGAQRNNSEKNSTGVAGRQSAQTHPPGQGQNAKEPSTIVLHNMIQPAQPGLLEPSQFSPLLTDSKSTSQGPPQLPHPSSLDTPGVTQGDSNGNSGNKTALSGVSAPSFSLFDANSGSRHILWASKTELFPTASQLPQPSQQLVISQSDVPPAEPAVKDAHLAPGYRSTAVASILTNSVVSIASSSAPGTPVASQNLRNGGNLQNRPAASTPPPLASSLAYCPKAVLTSRTPPPILASMNRIAPVSLSPVTSSMPLIRSCTPPVFSGAGVMMHASRMQQQSVAPPSLAPGGPTSIRTERPHLNPHQVNLSEMNNLIQQQLEQQQLQQIQQAHSGFANFSSHPNILNSPQFTTPQTNTQPVFSNNISVTPQIQSNLNPNAPDFSSRANNTFITPTTFSRPAQQLNQGPFLNNSNSNMLNNTNTSVLNNSNANVMNNNNNSNVNNSGGIQTLGNNLMSPMFSNFHNLAGSLDAAANLTNFNTPIASFDFLKAAGSHNLASLHQSPQTSSPASPTPVLQQQQLMDERLGAASRLPLRPIGTERAQKRSVISGPSLSGTNVILPPGPQAPPMTNLVGHQPNAGGGGMNSQPELWSGQGTPLFLHPELDLQQNFNAMPGVSCYYHSCLSHSFFELGYIITIQKSPFNFDFLMYNVSIS